MIIPTIFLLETTHRLPEVLRVHGKVALLNANEHHPLFHMTTDPNPNPICSIAESPDTGLTLTIIVAREFGFLSDGRSKNYCFLILLI